MARRGDDVTLSKALSYALRHGATKMGLEMQSGRIHLHFNFNKYVHIDIINNCVYEIHP